jgi:TatD DNase family protein
MEPCWIDSHCHIGMCKSLSEAQVVQHALDNGVGILINVAIDGYSSREVTARSERHECVYATIGIHPHDSEKARDSDFDWIAENYDRPKVVAIGEIGLDFYRDYAPRDIQRQVFETQLRFAAQRDIPVVIHSRKAWDDTISMVKEVASEYPLKGVFHCWGYGPEEMKPILELGFYISFPGALTYENSKKLQTTARRIPLEFALIETDAPFITPAKYKKETPENLPGYVVETAKALASLRDIPLDQLKDRLYENTLRCFPKLALALEKV